MTVNLILYTLIFSALAGGLGYLLRRPAWVYCLMAVLVQIILFAQSRHEARLWIGLINLVPFIIYFLVATRVTNLRDSVRMGFLLMTLHLFYMGLSLKPEGGTALLWLAPLYETLLVAAVFGVNFIVDRLVARWREQKDNQKNLRN